MSMTIVKGGVIAIVNGRGIVKGKSHRVRGASMFGGGVVDTVCGQSFFSDVSPQLRTSDKRAVAVLADRSECARCA